MVHYGFCYLFLRLYVSLLLEVAHRNGDHLCDNSNIENDDIDDVCRASLGIIWTIPQRTYLGQYPNYVLSYCWTHESNYRFYFLIKNTIQFLTMFTISEHLITSADSFDLSLFCLLLRFVMLFFVFDNFFRVDCHVKISRHIK